MSVTRISTLDASQTLLNYMMGTESDYYKLSEESSSGYKVSTISDNASSTKSLLDINSGLDKLKGYLSSMSTAQTELDTLDDTLNSLTDKVQDAIDLVTEASNGTYSTADYSNIKTQIDSITQSVVDLANTQYDGKYIFSGTATGTKTYDITTTAGTITSIAYKGTDSSSDYKRYVTISDGESVAINTTGDQVFGSYNVTGTTTTAVGIIGTLMTISNALSSGDSTAVRSTLDTLNTELDSVSSIRTQFASVTNRFDSTESSISTSITNLTSQRSDLRDADLSDVLSQLAMKQTALSATYNVFSTVSSMSLLNYL